MSKINYVSTPKELIDFLIKDKKNKQNQIKKLKEEIKLLAKFIKIFMDKDEITNKTVKES